MAATAWVNTVPAAGETVGTGDDRMREDRVLASERLKQGGHYMNNADAVSNATENDDGKHVVGTGPNAGPHIYKSNRTDKLISFPDDNTVDMTAATSILGPGVSSAADPGHSHSGTITFRVGGVLAGGRAIVLFDGARDIQIYSVHIMLGTKPSAGTFEMDLGDLGALADNVNPYSAAYTSIFNAGARPKITAASLNFSQTVTGANFAGALSQFVLTAGHQLGLDIITAGTSTADLHVFIKGRKL